MKRKIGTIDFWRRQQQRLVWCGSRIIQRQNRKDLEEARRTNTTATTPKGLFYEKYLLDQDTALHQDTSRKAMNIFKKKVSAKDAAKAAKKETKREVRSSQRDMEREIRELDREEKKLLAQIKQRAKQPGVKGMNDSALKSMAKNLVQIRNQKNKLYSTKANLNSVGMTATSMATQVAATAAIGDVSGAMVKINQAIDAKEMTKIMTDFQRQNEVMEVRQELMDDALTDAFDAEDLDAEADEVTGQVLAELGIEMDQQMVGLSAPSQMPAGAVAEEDALADAMPDLKARLDAL